MKDKKDIIIRVNDKIQKLRAFKTVVKSGNGAVIYLPKELLGKLVEVKYDLEIKQNGTN